MSTGVILYDKPAGVTSHDVVARVRRRFPRGVKVGHAGTLDPFATGLLLVLVGRATRVQRFLMELPKTYEAVGRFGFVSSTGDPDGEIVATGAVPEGHLDLPTGVLAQRPPAYSAVKVGGRRAYALARAGEHVELAERSVEVYRFEERGRDGDRRAFLIECSSGTYVRSLIAALGDAYCEQLRRTRIGRFDVADADPDRVIELSEALSFLPELHLSGEDARRAAHGSRLSVTRPPALANGPLGIQPRTSGPAESHPACGVVRLLDDDGLIALAEPRASDGTLKPIVGFRG